MQEFKAECVLEAQATLGEGSWWDADIERLWWVDIESSLVCRYNPANGANRTWPMGAHVGTLVPTLKGDLITAGFHGFQRLDPESGKVTDVIDPEADRPNTRFNDGKCDPQGRFWAGTIPYDRTPGAANLYVLDANLKVRQALDNLGNSNGLTWNAAGDTMYYIDTPTRRVDAFDFDGATGSISNRRQVVRVPDDMGKPDGMTIDAEGMLWVCLWGGWAVSRWDPQSGELLAKVNLPVKRVTSCAFGGADLEDLYITTARSGMEAEELSEQPLSGGLFRAHPGVQGVPLPKFAG